MIDNDIISNVFLNGFFIGCWVGGIVMVFCARLKYRRQYADAAIQSEPPSWWQKELMLARQRRERAEFGKKGDSK